MQFDNPLVLFFWLLIPAMVLVDWLNSLSIAKRLGKIGDREFIKDNIINTSFMSLKLKNILFYLAVFFIVFALAKPILPYGEQEIKRKGSNLVIALDLSPSMLAMDVKPNRLERAKQELISLIAELGQHQLGLVIFSGTAFVQVPLTFDHQWLASVLGDLTPENIVYKGTDLTAALERSYGMFTKDLAGKSILMITDGEDHQTGLDDITSRLAKEHIPVYLIGVGSPAGAPIPIISDGKVVDYKKDKYGKIVISKLRTDILKQIAEKTSGAFFVADQDSFNLRKIYSMIDRLQKKKVNVKTKVLAVELYQYFLFIGFVLLLSYFWPETKNEKL